MIQQLKLVLPWPPSVNHYWGVRGKVRFLTKRGKEFRQAVAEAVAEAGIKMTGRLFVAVALYPPNRIRRDIDNSMKALFDALQHAGCYDDDEQIDKMLVVRAPVQSGGLCRLVIGNIPDKEAVSPDLSMFS